MGKEQGLGPEKNRVPLTFVDSPTFTNLLATISSHTINVPQAMQQLTRLEGRLRREDVLRREVEQGGLSFEAHVHSVIERLTKTSKYAHLEYPYRPPETSNYRFSIGEPGGSNIVALLKPDKKQPDAEYDAMVGFYDEELGGFIIGVIELKKGGKRGTNTGERTAKRIFTPLKEVIESHPHIVGVAYGVISAAEEEKTTKLQKQVHDIGGQVAACGFGKDIFNQYTNELKERLGLNPGTKVQ